MIRSIRIVAILIMCTCLSWHAHAEFDPFSANIEENIATPAVSAKNSPLVAATMGQLVKTLRSSGYAVDAVRNGEVAMITIPCDQLFSPNSIELMPVASKKLTPLLPYIKRTDNYKVILAVHADDTGDDVYAERLTADRANAIDEFFFQANAGETGIIPYGLGADEPVASNIGVENRRRNRRVEIYFVPTELFIDKAKKRRE